MRRKNKRVPPSLKKVVQIIRKVSKKMKLRKKIRKKNLKMMMMMSRNLRALDFATAHLMCIRSLTEFSSKRKASSRKMMIRKTP